MVRPSCAHREPTAPFAAHEVKTQAKKLFGKSQARANLLTIRRIIAA
jgi:hypothetical protein